MKKQLLEEGGMLKLLIANDGLPSLPDPDGCVNGNEMKVKAWEIYAAIVSCGSSPQDFLPRKIRSKKDEIILKRNIIEFCLYADDLCITRNVRNLIFLE